eukprot:2418573-Pleurochrysis_carterae.AAC.1
MRLASLPEVILDHAETPSSAVKKGIVLDPPPGSRSAAGMSSWRACHALSSASYAHSGSAPVGPSIWR